MIDTSACPAATVWGFLKYDANGYFVWLGGVGVNMGPTRSDPLSASSIHPKNSIDACKSPYGKECPDDDS